MRTKTAALLLAVTMTACTRSSSAGRPVPLMLSLHPVVAAASPSPLVEVRVGHVRGVFPKAWEAEMLPSTHLPQEGFVASPHIGAWLRGGANVPGIEAFWIDGDQLPIPSDYYYLAARDASFGELPNSCGSARQRVFANHPPDLLGGAKLSPGDYVAGAAGVCERGRLLSHWAYVVAAPGFGPARHVGIPSSELYVVLAEVSGPRGAQLLTEMMKSASFGGASIREIAQAASGRPL